MFGCMLVGDVQDGWKSQLKIVRMDMPEGMNDHEQRTMSSKLAYDEQKQETCVELYKSSFKEAPITSMCGLFTYHFYHK